MKANSSWPTDARILTGLLMRVDRLGRKPDRFGALMFTIKDGFAFGELGRRGIEAVRDELLEKALAYNCCRRILLRQRQREELERAA